MPVYVLQEGRSNIFKIGLTTATVEQRRNKLNSGNSAGLRTFCVLDITPVHEGEAFLHRVLNHRRIAGHGGTEFFEMLSEEHMRALLEVAVPLFKRFQAACKGLRVLEEAQASERMLSAEPRDYAALSDLRELRDRLRELEDEAAILRAEADILEAKLKLRIGTCSGISDVATWESGTPRRTFCQALFVQNEPKIYQEVLGRFQVLDHKTWRMREPALYREVTGRYPILDTTAWRSSDGDLYQRMRALYFTSRVSRKFLIVTR